MKNVQPQREQTTMTVQRALRAVRYWAEVVEVAVSAKRRMYWNRMASLMKVVLEQ
jgi:hypothetical protein